MSLSSEALALRMRRITGTTGAAVLGVSPYDTPLSAYQQILGLSEFTPNEATYWGLALQQAVADRFARDHQMQPEACETRAHSTEAYLAASGDYRLPSGELLEIKTAASRQRENWGEPGSDATPWHYMVQCVIQMAVYDAPAVWVAVLFGGQEYAEYRVVRDLELEAEVLAQLGAWHARHIVAEVPPDATCPTDMLEYLKNRYPQDDGEVREATPEIDRAVHRLAIARGVKADAEEMEREARAEIEEFMGEAGELRSTYGKVTWRTAKPSTVVDWKTIVTRLDPDPAYIDAHTTIKPGARSFRPNVKENPNVIA